MLGFEAGTEVCAYYFGQLYGKLRKTQQGCEYAMMDWSTGQLSPYHAVETRPITTQLVGCTAPFFLCPLEQICYILTQLPGTVQAGEDLALGEALYQKSGTLAHCGCPQTEYYTDKYNRAQAVDLLVCAGQPIGIICTDYFESVVFTLPEFCNDTPVVQWREEGLSQATRGYKLYRTDTVKTRDNITLLVEIYMPADYTPGEKLPTILSRTPYDIRTKVDRGIRLGGYGERRKRETGRPKQGGLLG